jgi:hypothetical protein
MPTYKCNGCGGTYDDPQSDGVRYFHACAPIVVKPAEGDPTKPGFVPAVYGPRPDHRDENVVVELDRTDPESPKHLPPTARTEGPGRTELKPA